MAFDLSVFPSEVRPHLNAARKQVARFVQTNDLKFLGFARNHLARFSSGFPVRELAEVFADILNPRGLNWIELQVRCPEVCDPLYDTLNLATTGQITFADAQRTFEAEGFDLEFMARLMQHRHPCSNPYATTEGIRALCNAARFAYLVNWGRHIDALEVYERRFILRQVIKTADEFEALLDEIEEETLPLRNSDFDRAPLREAFYQMRGWTASR